MGKPRIGKYFGLISEEMTRVKETGDPRDFVIVSNSSVVTHKKAYDVTKDGEPFDVRNETGEALGFRTLYHRKDLPKYFHADFASVFWKDGKRTSA